MKWICQIRKQTVGEKQQEKIRGEFFDPETVSVRQAEMYMEVFF